MKILVRLPNWLGDMVMAVGFMNQLEQYYPGALVSVIAKKGIHQLLEYFPPIEHQFVFSKEEYPGIQGPYGFGKMIGRQENFDLYFSLPDSLSTAITGFATGAKKRVGYSKEMRQLLLTDSFTKPKGLHRVEEYVHLLESYTGRPHFPINVALQHHYPKEDYVVVNINSEASSRRLTVAKAVELIDTLASHIQQGIVMIGAPKEKEFIDAVVSNLRVSFVENLAGRTDLNELIARLAGARVVLSTDSGPAHLANALGTKTVVLFGAGNENNTAPYNKSLLQVIRLGQLSCEPCQKNVCVRFETPQCLERLDSRLIAASIKTMLA